MWKHSDNIHHRKQRLKTLFVFSLVRGLSAFYNKMQGRGGAYYYFCLRWQVRPGLVSYDKRDNRLGRPRHVPSGELGPLLAGGLDLGVPRLRARSVPRRQRSGARGATKGGAYVGAAGMGGVSGCGAGGEAEFDTASSETNPEGFLGGSPPHEWEVQVPAGRGARSLALVSLPAATGKGGGGEDGDDDDDSSGAGGWEDTETAVGERRVMLPPTHSTFAAPCFRAPSTHCRWR